MHSDAVTPGSTSLSCGFCRRRSSVSRLPLSALTKSVVKELCSKVSLTHKVRWWELLFFFFFFFKLALFAHWILQISPLGREVFPQIALKWTVSVNTSAHIKKITLWHVDSGNLGVWWQWWLVWFPSWMPPPVYDHPALTPMWRRRRWIASCDEEKRRESSTFLVHGGLTKTQNLRGAESEWLPCPWHLINATYQVSKRMDESGHRFIVTGNDVFFLYLRLYVLYFGKASPSVSL